MSDEAKIARGEASQQSLALGEAPSP